MKAFEVSAKPAGRGKKKRVQKKENRNKKTERSEDSVRASGRGRGGAKRDEMCKNKVKAFEVSAKPAGRKKRTNNKVSQLD